jgi:hypothetical protein
LGGGREEEERRGERGRRGGGGRDGNRRRRREDEVKKMLYKQPRDRTALEALFAADFRTCARTALLVAFGFGCAVPLLTMPNLSKLRRRHLATTWLNQAGWPTAIAFNNTYK